MISQAAEPEHASFNEKTARDADKGSETTKNGDLERLQTTKEGELLAQNAEAAKREWIKTAPESPRNWPLWRKLSIIVGLLFYTNVIFICSTGFVTDDAEEHFGVNSQKSVMGQSMVRALFTVSVAENLLLASGRCTSVRPGDSDKVT